MSLKHYFVRSVPSDYLKDSSEVESIQFDEYSDGKVLITIRDKKLKDHSIVVELKEIKLACEWLSEEKGRFWTDEEIDTKFSD